tara:strand:- start:2389 stop:2535 length:147 start_codon:yes stop_codon:yes gene_type:complete
MTIKSYIKEIETQAQKPIEVQLEELKIAGAKLLQAFDNYIAQTNKEQS